MSVTGDFAKFSVIREKAARAMAMGPAVAKRAAPELSSKSITFAPEGNALVGTLRHRYPASWRSPLPGKWREDLQDAAREEFEAITGGA